MNIFGNNFYFNQNGLKIHKRSKSVIETAFKK